jgi:hypothetical protein
MSTGATGGRTIRFSLDPARIRQNVPPDIVELFYSADLPGRRVPTILLSKSSACQRLAYFSCTFGAILCVSACFRCEDCPVGMVTGSRPKQVLETRLQTA